MSSASDHGKSNVSIRLAYILDEIRASCSGSSPDVAPIVYGIFEPILLNLSKVLDLMHNFQAIVVAIFELLSVVVDKLKGGPGLKINTISTEVLNVYVKHNGNRFSAERTAEEDSLEDLMLLLKLANNFLNIALFDTQSKCAQLFSYMYNYIFLIFA